MDGLALQIDGKWAVLDDDGSVDIENNSPVWGEGNSFSLPFELDIEANRHILGNADQITGQSVYEVLDGKRAVLYTLGIPVYYGKIKMDDEVELSEGKVDITLVSGNLTFDEMIDGMNCQDVELMDEIIVGMELRNFVATFKDMVSDGYVDCRIDTPSKKFIVNKESLNGKSTINVTYPYPEWKYCNIRVAYQKYTVYHELDADRSASGLCFYVLYFLDCLFHKLNISVSKNVLPEMEDMKRLAFVSTLCAYDWGDNISGSSMSFEDFGIINVTAKRTEPSAWADKDYSDKAKSCTLGVVTKMKANSKNFPNCEVSEVIDALKNAFGILFLYDERISSMTLLYVKDILRDSTIYKIAAEIYDQTKVENNTLGFELAYSSGGDDDTSFNYDDYSQVVEESDYNEIRNNLSPYDKTLYINPETGNAYRIKVDEEAETDSSKDLNPALFQVGQFVSAKYGDCSNESRVEKKEISFTPIVENDIGKLGNDNVYALFLDVDATPATSATLKLNAYGRYGSGKYCSGTGAAQICFSYYFKKIVAECVYKDEQYSENQSEEGSPVNQYDPGFMLGVMRGPGGGAEVVDENENYDGEGNLQYYVSTDNYSFTSDNITDFGKVFDYNGTADGGVEISGSFSLKPRAEKPNPDGGFYPITQTYAQKRGLFDKFYTEYAYFVVNRKIVRMTCRMEMADLLNIDWTKRYKIGEYVGFINKYSYSVSSTGISDVELEMYYI